MLTLKQAADYIGISPEDLLMSRQKGLPPGNLGVAKNGEVFFNQDDLLPPSRLTGHLCPDCGFEAKSAGGLKTHRRRHG
jgi:hypothetical protein